MKNEVFVFYRFAGYKMVVEAVRKYVLNHADNRICRGYELPRSRVQIYVLFSKDAGAIYN